jgi:branched-chain amino acid transport system substrate-binding protein
MNKRDSSRFVCVFTIIATIISFFACDRIEDFGDHSDQILIGLVLPLTGRLSVSSGRSMEQALEFARNEISASRDLDLKFIIEDDGSTVDGAISAYKKLIYVDRVSVILGPATSTATKQTFPIAKENHIVAISPTSAASGLSAISDNVFRIALTSDVLVPKGIEATYIELGYKNVATLYDETDDFSIDSEKVLQETLTAKGVKVVITETFKAGETDFSAQLSRIHALNPDVIFVSCLAPEKPGLLIEGSKQGIDVPFIIRTLTDAEVEVAGDAAEGAMTFVGWGSAIDTPGNQDFVHNYSDTYGMLPDNYAARSYAALHILAEAIANAESGDVEAIRTALANISNFETILGNFSFDENGDAVYEPKILIVKNGKLVRFE